MEPKLKTNFAVQTKYKPFYTGGKVQFTEDGEHVFTQCGEQVHILHVATGKTTHVISNDEGDLVTCFCVTPDSEHVIVACQSLQLKQWQWQEAEAKLTRKWKAIHTAPVSCMAFDVTSTLLATGGADSTVKVWDIIKQYCTHNLKGHTGVVSIAKFHPDISRLQLWSAGEDYKIRGWDLSTSVCTVVLDSHFSLVTCLTLHNDVMLSAARDNVVILWHLEGKTATKEKTFPVYESVEGLVLLPEDEDFSAIGVSPSTDVRHLMTAGSKGVLKVWNSRSGDCVFTQQNSQKEPAALVDLSFNSKSGSFNVVTFDHNIMLYGKKDLAIQKQLIGYNDEILDVKLLGEESHIAVATNSPVIKVYEVATWNCQVLAGHTDIVLALDVYKQGSLLVSTSKDNTIRVWCMEPETKQLYCIAVGNGHTHSVASVAFSRQSASFVVSGSEDLTIKLWMLEEEYDVQNTVPLMAKYTEKAHDKDINSIAVSPNDKLVATGSQDRTAKLWSSADLSLVGVFKGHKRGIWCVQFSPVDQCLVTASADGSIKIWTLGDLGCVKTFEGHESSVLRVEFICRGMQLISSGSDGLLKLWTVKSNECVKTLDAHEDKIWAMAVSQNEDVVYTGAGDSHIVAWKDVTEEEWTEKIEQQEDLILKEQELSNLLLQKKYLKAIGLAITLDQPYRVLGIIKEILKGSEGKEELERTLVKLRDDQIDSILRYAVTWNTNSRHCHVAQCIVGQVLRSRSPEELSAMPNFKETVEGLIPYTERHFQRMNRLLQQAMFVTYTWNSMSRIAVDAEKTSSAMDTQENVSEPVKITMQPKEEESSSSDESEQEEEEKDSGVEQEEEEETEIVQMPKEKKRKKKHQQQKAAIQPVEKSKPVTVMSKSKERKNKKRSLQRSLDTKSPKLTYSEQKRRKRTATK